MDIWQLRCHWLDWAVYFEAFVSATVDYSCWRWTVFGTYFEKTRTIRHQPNSTTLYYWRWQRWFVYIPCKCRHFLCCCNHSKL